MSAGLQIYSVPVASLSSSQPTLYSKLLQLLGFSFPSFSFLHNSSILALSLIDPLSRYVSLMLLSCIFLSSIFLPSAQPSHALINSDGQVRYRIFFPCCGLFQMPQAELSLLSSIKTSPQLYLGELIGSLSTGSKSRTWIPKEGTQNQIHGLTLLLDFLI